jgi:hypothetical protein
VIVAYHARDAGTDVIQGGREPRAHPRLEARLVRLLVLAETAALAGSVAAALHYRAETVRLHHGRPPAAIRPLSTPSLPSMTSVGLRLPADGSITGTVLITAAAQPGAGRGQFVVSAVITGGRPDTVYDLTGNDCSAAAPLPDHAWATGRTGPAGTAELTGGAWAGAVADEYWLALASSPVNPPPGLRGKFGQATASPFPAGQAPCALP